MSRYLNTIWLLKWNHVCIVVFIKYTNQKLYNINSKSKHKWRYSSEFRVSSSIKNHQSFSPFLVHYSVSTFCASDWIPWFYFIFCVTFSTDIYHWLLLWALNVLLGVHCCTHVTWRNFSVLANRFWLTAVSPLRVL